MVVMEKDDMESETSKLSPNSNANANFEMVKVDQNGQPQQDQTPQPPLIALAQQGDKIGLVKYLNKIEGDPTDELFQKDKLGRTALHWAADNGDLDLGFECGKLLVERVQSSRKKEFINATDNQARTALIWSSAKGNAILMRYLIESGTDPKIKDKLNKTPLHFIAELAEHEKALECASIYLQAPEICSGDKLLFDIINEKELYSERTALHLATIAGNELLMRFIIENGANVLECDSNQYSVLHHSVINAYPEKALVCTQILLNEGLLEETVQATLLDMKEKYGKGAIHIAARRGNHLVLRCLRENSVNYTIQEDATGSTALHLAASLGNETKASDCVAELLHNLTDPEKSFLVNVQNNDKFTAMYLAAKHRNVDACKHLLRAGSAFDKKTSHGKTPLEKVYKRIPEAIIVLLDKAVETSGYANRFGSIDSYADMNFAPILGINTNNQNKYKEIEELAKIQYAKWDQRRAILSHPFIRVFIWKKWEKISWIFSLLRFFHMLWFISIFVFLVMIYRVNCPYKSTKNVKFSWTSLRPAEEEENNSTLKSLDECDFAGAHIAWGVFNLVGLIIFCYGLILQTKNRYHWFYKPLREKPQLERTTLDKFGIVFILHYLKAFFQIFPIMSIILVGLVLIITAPVFGIFPMNDEAQYSVVGLMGFIVWFGFYLEVGKIPLCRVYINLLWKASSTLGLAILIHLPILFGFAAVFVLLMQRMPSFSSASQAVVKVLTLMIGELDYEGLFYGEEDKTGNILFAGIEMVALAIFVVFVAVLLLNFLIGLAADEIKDFRERAEVWHLCTQIEQISLLESFLDQRCFKDFLRKKLMLMPPKKNQEQRRRLEVYIPTLPKKMQREIHNLNLKTMPEEK